MSTGIFDCHLIKKINLWQYICDNKALIEERLANSSEAIQNFYPISDLIQFYMDNGDSSSRITRRIMKGDAGTKAYLKAKHEKEVDCLDDYEKFLDKSFNSFDFDIWVSILNVDLKEHLIVIDRFGILKSLYLADLSFVTSCDGWVAPFAEAVKKFELFSTAGGDYETASKLAEMMEASNFSKPRVKIELYTQNRTYNFLDECTVFALIQKEVESVIDSLK